MLFSWYQVNRQWWAVLIHRSNENYSNFRSVESNTCPWKVCNAMPLYRHIIALLAQGSIPFVLETPTCIWSWAKISSISLKYSLPHSNNHWTYRTNLLVEQVRLPEYEQAGTGNPTSNGVEKLQGYRRLYKRGSASIPSGIQFYTCPLYHLRAICLHQDSSYSGIWLFSLA